MYKYLGGESRRQRGLERFREEVARLVEARLERAVAADHSGAIEVLLLCIGRLPERMRRVVRDGLAGSKPKELAKELETTAGAVYRLHYRANQLLRECMQKELG